MAHRSDLGLSASRLRVTNIPGTTRVRLAQPSATQMAIELSGPESLIKDISWEVRDGTLHVTGPAGGGGTIISSGPGFQSVIRGSRGGMIVSSAGGQTVISTGGRGGQVIVNGKIVSGPGAGGAAEAGEAELTVYVPEGTPVQVADDGAGNYELNDLRGTLDLKIEGHSQVRAGVMRATRISIGGSGGVEIAAVLDALRVNISGSGHVDVAAGEVGQLTASISGSGRVSYAGTAADADLDVSGSGRIRVDTVTGSLHRDVSGSGRIDVREQPRRSRDDFWS
jgi:hypothetical protein